MIDYKPEQKGAVLYVDDEQNNLNSFRSSFRREFRVYTANNAVEALKQLKQYPEIKVIISDQRMPDVTGVQFFEKIRHIYPNKVRIILTGYSDIKAVVDAINKGQVYRFIDKPWDNDLVRIAVQDGMELFDTRKTLATKNESLQDAYNELDKFVYSVSHDLRSPLMSILGIANLAELDIEDEKSLEYFGTIKSMVGKLDGYIHQIIDHYKGTHGSEFSDDVDFKLLINEIIESIKYHPSAQGVEFKVSVNQDGAFTSNQMNIKTILSNLISNAFKYQREEEPNKLVEIEAKINNAHAEVIVRDNGIGIKQDKKEEVFNMFYRAKQDDTGSGLGLFIVSEAIEKLGGKIELDSQFGKGTEIKLSVPGKGE
ncbi:MAG: hybrid sensor histidine kinase/response regulator [Salibacteraceae bacterium]